MVFHSISCFYNNCATHSYYANSKPEVYFNYNDVLNSNMNKYEYWKLIKVPLFYN